MAKKINTISSESSETFSSIVINVEKISAEILDLLLKESCIKLNNEEKISMKEIQEELENCCNILIDKYGFNELEGMYFMKSISLHPCEEVPEHPKCRGMSWSSIVSSDNLSTKCEIFINSDLVVDCNLYFSILFHELDHHAFYCKKLSEEHISDLQTLEERKQAIDLFTREITGDDTCSYFSTELLARVDATNYLLSRQIARDKIYSYQLGESPEAPWRIYNECIEYAKKFIEFQKNLYDILLKHFGLNSDKKEQQILGEGEKHFKEIMKSLWDKILYSTSIENSKFFIDDFCEKIGNSKSRDDFSSAIGYGL